MENAFNVTLRAGRSSSSPRVLPCVNAPAGTRTRSACGARPAARQRSAAAATIRGRAIGAGNHTVTVGSWPRRSPTSSDRLLSDADQVQLSHAGQVAPVDLAEGDEADVARDLARERNPLLVAVAVERARRDGRAPGGAVGARVKLVLRDHAAGVLVLAGQGAQAGQRVARAEIDLDLVRVRGRVRRIPRVPDRRRR